MFSSSVMFLGLAYVVGTMFGYAVALRRGRREGLESSLDSLIHHGYIRSKVDKNGETILYKYWEDHDKS